MDGRTNGWTDGEGKDMIDEWMQWMGMWVDRCVVRWVDVMKEWMERQM